MFPSRVTSVLGLAVAAATTGCATSMTGAPSFTSQSPSQTPTHERSSLVTPSGSAVGHYAIGAMALASGRHASAVARFRAALELDPRHVEALNGIGVAYGEMGRHAEAVQSFEQALAVVPDTAHVLSNLGYAQLRAGRPEAAWRSLSRSFELDPSSPRTRANLLIALHSREKAPPAAAPGDSVRIESASGESETMRVEPTMRIGHSAAPTAPTASPASPASPAPSVPVAADAHAPFTVVTNRVDDPGLVRVSANVYELRLPEQTVAVASPRRPAPGSASASASVRAARGPVPRLEVSNGVGLSRLASRTAAELARLGYPQARVSNARPYGFAQSQLQYRPGHEAQARQLADALGVAVEVVATERLARAVDLRLVIGLDLATWEQTARLSQPQLARAPATTPAAAAAGAPAVVATPLATAEATRF